MTRRELDELTAKQNSSQEAENKPETTCNDETQNRNYEPRRTHHVFRFLAVLALVLACFALFKNKENADAQKAANARASQEAQTTEQLAKRKPEKIIKTKNITNFIGIPTGAKNQLAGQAQQALKQTTGSTPVVQVAPNTWAFRLGNKTYVFKL